MAKALKRPLPSRSSRGYRFVLTPLADAMFQLLIFFMLSSNLAPYSLLLLRSGDAGESPGGGGAAPSDFVPDPGVAIWQVDAEQVVVGGLTIGFDRLPDLAQALSADGEASVVLILRDTALVQDLTTVLEALTGAGIKQVQIAAGGQT